MRREDDEEKLGNPESNEATTAARHPSPPLTSPDAASARIGQLDDPPEGQARTTKDGDEPDPHRTAFVRYIGESRAVRELLSTIDRVAPTNASVFVSGETGAGKEVIARYIHDRSKRPGEFVAVNCAALPEHLIESELFGHVKGAFTGAICDREGVFEVADGGTVFLDEIGDMPLAMQVKLLRVLEERQIKRVGHNRIINIDVRVVAATNKAIEEEVKAGRFREDLYYRLAVVQIALPALRDRVDDIPLLVKHFLKRFAESSGRAAPTVTTEAMEMLLAYGWPGNVRELRNVIERACVLRDVSTNAISTENLPERVSGAAATKSSVMRNDGGVGSSPRSEIDGHVDERAMLIHALTTTYGDRTAAAKRLGINRSTLYRRMSRHGITGDEINKRIASK